MAAFHGKSGTATFSGLTFLLTGFSVDASADIVEITDCGDSVKTYVVGYKDWTASATSYLDSSGGGIAALGTSATLTFDTTTGLAYSGTAICNGFSVSLDHAGVPQANFSFQGSGTLGEA